MTLKGHWIHEVLKQNVLSMTAKRSRNYHDRHRWKKNLQTLIDWGKNLWLTLCEKMLLQFRVASCFPLFLLEYRVILGKEQGKSRKGKNYQIRKRKNTHQIFDISSPPEYGLSLLFGPVCCVSQPTNSRAKREDYMKAWNYIKNDCDRERSKVQAAWQ